ncbi:hypothetical protein ACIQIE_35950 [Streptomyces globisporus]|uniref:hypothetical protein n=1 Tax=Streptomyces globisporus TaxID=1908 RepID=UPI0034610E15|nr:hypothetical protein OG838_36085 [Streptomyces globisporus]
MISAVESRLHPELIRHSTQGIAVIADQAAASTGGGSQGGDSLAAAGTSLNELAHHSGPEAGNDVIGQWQSFECLERVEEANPSPGRGVRSGDTELDWVMSEPFA